MKAFSDPTLFSKHFNINPQKLSKAGLIDPFLDVDTQLFIDPILLEKSAIPQISQDAHTALRAHFGNVFRLLAISAKEGDPPWRAAQRLLELAEAPFNGLGYGKGDRDGTSRPDELRDKILRTSKEVVQLGEADPEMISTRLHPCFYRNRGFLPPALAVRSVPLPVGDLMRFDESYREGILQVVRYIRYGR